MLPRKVYTREFKEEAVELTYRSDKTVKEIAADMDIPYQLLCKWRRRLTKEGKSAFPGHGNIPDKDKDLKALQKEYKNVVEERDILKKALAIFSKTRGTSL